MKRYKINKQAGNSCRWRYAGSVDSFDSQELLEQIGRFGINGFRVIDTQTNEVVFEKSTFKQTK